MRKKGEGHHPRLPAALQWQEEKTTTTTEEEGKRGKKREGEEKGQLENLFKVVGGKDFRIFEIMSRKEVAR